MRFGNSLVKGLKVASQVAAGVVGFGLSAAALGFTPNAGPVVGILWTAVGAGAVGGLGALLTRYATYNPALDPNKK
jgi:hypothetical protein